MVESSCPIDADHWIFYVRHTCFPSMLVAGRERLGLCARMSQDCAGAKGYRYIHRLRKNAPLFALFLTFLPAQVQGSAKVRPHHLAGIATAKAWGPVAQYGGRRMAEMESKENTYLTLEKSATILASCPS